MTTFEWIQTFAISLGFIFSFLGYKGWVREHSGKNKMALAEDTLALFYEARDVIQAIRSPIGWAGEVEKLTRRTNETEDAFQTRKELAIIENRYSIRSEFFSKIHSLKYRFQSVFSEEEAQPFKDLHKINSKIKVAARSMVRLQQKSDSLSPEDEKARQDKYLQLDNIVYSHGGKDEIAEQLDKIITDIESVCKRAIKKGS